QLVEDERVSSIPVGRRRAAVPVRFRIGECEFARQLQLLSDRDWQSGLAYLRARDGDTSSRGNLLIRSRHLHPDAGGAADQPWNLRARHLAREQPADFELRVAMGLLHSRDFTSQGRAGEL